jgi:hypothetical protein
MADEQASDDEPSLDEKLRRKWNEIVERAMHETDPAKLIDLSWDLYEAMREAGHLQGTTKKKPPGTVG